VLPTPGTEPSWFGFPLFTRAGISRPELIRFLESRRIGTRLLFAGNITKQPSFQGVKYVCAGALENTDTVMKTLFWIGTHPKLMAVHLEYMLENLEEGIRAQIS
jgi:CDP-6-deoxy-D-xylo-4-hexulose-3-dehydrase